MYPTRSFLVALAVTFTSMAIVCGTAIADDPPVVEVSATVRDLNEKAVNKVVLGEYDEAIKLLDASLQLQELNITYLNLGRVYQYTGECELARKAWASALEADRVEEPSHQQIVATLFEYRKELDAECKESEEPTVVADAPAPDTTPTPAPDPLPDPEPIVEPEPAMSADTATSYSPWSWIALGTGAALVVSAVAIDAAAIGPKFDELDDARRDGDQAAFDAAQGDIETLQAVNIALISVGGAAIATGAVLLILDLTADDGEAGVAMTPTVTRESAGAALTIRY